MRCLGDVMGYWSYAELKTYGRTGKPAKSVPIYKGQARNSIIANLGRFLDDWRYSVFEREGAAVAGFRSMLCRLGYRWSLADHEARTLVAEALRRNGARRPTWAEGQPEHVIEEEACKWCRGDISGLQSEGKKFARFCSEECAKSFMRYRERNSEVEYDQTWAYASAMVYRSSLALRICATCSKKFRPIHETKAGSYCSPPCYHEALRAAEEVFECTCIECSATFSAKKKHAKFCGKECNSLWNNRVRREKAAERRKTAQPAARSARHPRTCPQCNIEFMAKSPLAIFCSEVCQKRGNEERKRGGAPSLPLQERCCPSCAKPFLPKSRLAVYCSRECTANNRKIVARIRAANTIHLTADIFDSWFRRAA